MDKKIGILTYHYSNNFGAVLQAYSLQMVLKGKGYDAKVINLVPNHGIKGKLKDVLIAPFTKGFTAFRKNHFNLYPKDIFYYESINEINFDDFDSIIVGSDQVWRKSYTQGLGYSYFLDFVPANVKRISYAASFGLDYFEGNDKDVTKIKECLKSFSLITLRENSGVKICKETFKADGDMVLDPVLLSPLEVYNFDKSEKNTNTNFVTQYLLDATKDKVGLANLIAKNLNNDLVINYKNNTKKLSLYNLFFDRKKEKFPSVKAWINNIKNSNFIITDSFHGVAFSILFNRQFICIFNEKRGKTRMQNLLNIFNLEHRAISENDIKKFTLESLKNIDYQQVNKILEDKKQFSLNLLFKHLG